MAFVLSQREQIIPHKNYKALVSARVFFFRFYVALTNVYVFYIY